MLTILGMVLAYLAACLPDFGFALSRIEKSKPVVRFSMSESTRVIEYLEFSLVWYVAIFELLKMIVFLGVLNSGNFFLFSAFMLGILIPFWKRDSFRGFSLYVFIFLLTSQFALGLIYAGLWMYMRKKASDLLPWLTLVAVGLAVLTFWVTLAEWTLVAEGLLLLGMEGVAMGLPMWARQKSAH